MKEIKVENQIELYDFDIKVNSYLTYDKIQQIINSVVKFEHWAERQQNIDMLVLYHATDIGKDDIEAYTHDEWLKSGVIDAVKSKIKNYYMIEEGIKYTESTERALAQIIERMPELLAPIEKVTKRGKSSTK